MLFNLNKLLIVEISEVSNVQDENNITEIYLIGIENSFFLQIKNKKVLTKMLNFVFNNISFLSFGIKSTFWILV